MTIIRRSVNVTCVLAGIIGCYLTYQNGSNAWITPDQQGEMLMAKRDFAAAATKFEDPFLRGVAEYRDGKFKESAATFTGLPGNDALFNQANSRVMLGQYDKAILLYRQILDADPNRSDAQNNLEIATIRAERIRDKGGRMTDGKLGADEIVFDSNAQNSSNDDPSQTETVELNDESLRSLWLREVQTTPSDFLKSKFSFQFAAEENKSVADAGNE